MKNKVINTRQIALNWWNHLRYSERLDYWYEHQQVTFTPSGSPDNLTGREIEMIFLKNRRIDVYLWQQFTILKVLGHVQFNLNQYGIIEDFDTICSDYGIE